MNQGENKYRSFFENSADAMLIIEKGKFVDCNLATVKMLGYENKEGVINKSPFDLSPEYQPDGRLSKDKTNEMIALAITQGNHRFDWDHLRKDGTVVPVEVALTAIQTDGDIHLHTTWRDATKRKQAESAKKESEALFRYTFEANPGPVIIAKIKNGLIIDVNKAFEVATGISRRDALGRNSEQLELWCDREQRQTFLEKLRDYGEATNFEADFKIHGGQIKTGLLSARIIQVNKENCMLLVIRDHTKAKETTQSLVERNQVKNDFISTTAHELKTPLTAILGFSELLLDPISSQSLSEKQKGEFLLQIHDRGEDLHQLVKDLLDISRIDSGLAMPINLQEADLTVLLKKAFNYYKIHEPEYSFELILPKGADDPIINVDSKRICQTLENLLSNAVKYSPKESLIVLKGELVPEGWKISVKDHGIGMSQDQSSKIFDKFYRANPSNSKVEGLGLGMSIVRQIIEEHSGTIHIESSLGTGTTITLHLPRKMELA